MGQSAGQCLCSVYSFRVSGCYGIGVSRVLAAVIEASHDSQGSFGLLPVHRWPGRFSTWPPFAGIVWPESVAPYKLCILPIGTKASPNYASAAQLYDRLQQAVPQLKGDIVLDDRCECICLVCPV